MVVTDRELRSSDPLDVLARSAEALLLPDLDERQLVDVAVDLLHEHFGPGDRYVLLHAPETAGPPATCWTTRTPVVAPGECWVPIVVGDSMLGVMGVQHRDRRAVNEDETRQLGAFARMLGLALVHARDHETRKKEIAELQAVSDIARQAAALDLGATMQMAVDSFQRVTTSDSTAIYLWDAASERLGVGALTFEASLYEADYRERVSGEVLRIGEGIVGWCARYREPLFIEDIAKDGRALPVHGTPLKNKSAIAIPLIVENRLIGVVRAVKMGIGAYRQDQFRFAQTLASQVALAIAAARAYEEIRTLSITDELTGIANARFVMRRLREEVALARRHDTHVSLLLIDSDSLKSVNDRFGHLEGNRVLIATAETLAATARSTDAVGRFGGDEFVVVLPRTGAEEALAAGERVRQAVSARTLRTSLGEQITSTVSVGVATYPSDGGEADELFRRADRGLYLAKQRGRDRVARMERAG